MPQRSASWRSLSRATWRRRWSTSKAAACASPALPRSSTANGASCCASTSPKNRHAPMASLEAGRLLADRYQLQDRLGDGGHAEVWKARDTQGGRVVALKFLHLRNGGAEEALPVLQH